MVPLESPPYYVVQFVCWNRNAISPFTSQLQYKFCLGRPSPNLWEGVELGGRLRYPVKDYHTGHHLLIETDTLSLFV